MATPALKDRRIWVVGGCVLAVVLAAATWFGLVSPERSDASQLRSQAADVDAQNALAATKNAELAKLDRGYSGLKTKLADAVDSLPPTSGLPAFTREATTLAAATGVNLSGITVGAISPAGAAASAAPPPTDDTTAAAAPTPAAAPTTAAAPSGPGTFTIAVTLLSQGSLQHQLEFLHALQTGPRRVLVTATQTSALGNGRVASLDPANTMTTQLTIFSQPMSSAQLSSLQKLLRATS
jgi:hypothetical protein